MLMGLFGGVTLGHLKSSLVKLDYLRSRVEKHQVSHNGKVSSALADREAAIRSIRDEVLEIAGMKI